MQRALCVAQAIRLECCVVTILPRLVQAPITVMVSAEEQGGIAQCFHTRFRDRPDPAVCAPPWGAEKDYDGSRLAVYNDDLRKRLPSPVEHAVAGAPCTWLLLRSSIRATRTRIFSKRQDTCAAVARPTDHAQLRLAAARRVAACRCHRFITALLHLFHLFHRC